MWWPFQRKRVNVFNAIRYPITELTAEQLETLPPALLHAWWKKINRPSSMAALLWDTPHEQYLKLLKQTILEYKE